MLGHSRPCQGRTRAGSTCRQPAVQGSHYCRVHGGKIPHGMAHQNYGQLGSTSPHLPGHYSKYIPAKLAADYHAARTDPDRLSTLHEISTWTAREQQLLKRVEPHDPGALWPTVAAAWATIQAAKTALDTATGQKDLPGMREAYQRFQQALTHGATAIAKAQEDYGLWQEIGRAHTMLLALRTQEHKRLLELQRYWNSEQIALRWGQFLHALWESCMAMLPKEAVRPLLTDFQRRIKELDQEFLDLKDAIDGTAPPRNVTP